MVITIKHWPRSASGREILRDCLRESFRAGRPYRFPEGDLIGDAFFDGDAYITGELPRPIEERAR